MGNLVRKPAQMLLNSVDSTTIVADAANKYVMLKDYGRIYADLVSHEGVAGEVLKAVTNNGAVNHYIIDLNPNITSADDLPLHSDIYVRKRERLAGQVGAFDDIRVSGKNYGFEIGSLQDAISSGKLGANDLKRLGDGIVKTAQGDRDPFAAIGVAGIFDVADPALATAIDINGTTYSEADFATLVTSINAGAIASAFTSNNVLYLLPKGNYDLSFANLTNLSAASGHGYLIGVSSLDVNYKVLAGIEEVYGSVAFEQDGVYPYLRDIEVSRIFPILPGMVGSNPPRPLMGVGYAMYEFTATHDAYSLSGFNHKDKYIEKLQVFVADTGTNISTFDSALSTAGFTTVS